MAALRCPVCSGNLAPERLDIYIWAFKCIHCGRIYEETILENKLFGPLEKPKRGSKGPRNIPNRKKAVC